MTERPVEVTRAVYDAGEKLNEQGNAEDLNGFELAADALHEHRERAAPPETISFWKSVFDYLMERETSAWDAPTIITENDGSKTVIRHPDPCSKPH